MRVPSMQFGLKIMAGGIYLDFTLARITGSTAGCLVFEAGNASLRHCTLPCTQKTATPPTQPPNLG